MFIDETLHKRLHGIRALALDCDGILTDNRITYAGEGKWLRSFSIRDGMGIKRLMKAGVKVAIITSTDSEDIKARADSLNIEDVFSGVEEKKEVFDRWLAEKEVDKQHSAYLGDDLPDLEILKNCGFSATAADAIPTVRGSVDYVSNLPGGCGAVREICDMILQAKEDR